MNVRYVTFGIIVDDIVFPRGETRMGVLGGGGPQTAWGIAAALGTGESVGLVAGVGSDFDPALLSPLRAAQVNLEGVRVTEHPTPRAWQVLEFGGRRTQVWRVPQESLKLQLARGWDVLPASYKDAQAFHWGVHPDEVHSLDFARQLRQQGRRVSLEPFRSARHPLNSEALAKLLGACDIFSPNLLEAYSLTDCADESSILECFRALGGQVLALRRGADGADVWDLQAREGVHVTAIPVDMVDEVGAGNAFCGALLARLDEGIDVAACHASVAAAYMVEHIGLPPTLPAPETYQARLHHARGTLRALAWPNGLAC